jgi:hypothetical protein
MPNVRAVAGSGTATSRVARNLGNGLLVAGAGLSMGGFVLVSPLWVAAGTLGLALGLVTRDASAKAWHSVTPMTIYAFATGLSCVANIAGLLAANSERRPLYFLYTYEEHLPLAMLLTLAGLLVPVAAFRATLALRLERSGAGLLPRVHGVVSDVRLLRWGAILGVMAIASRVVMPLTGLGTISALFGLLPQLLVFALARRGVMIANRRMIFAALGLAVLEATRALMFDFLRGDIIAPVIAFAIGTILGARSFRVVRTSYFLPIYAVTALFIVYFGLFGAERSRVSVGITRLEQLVELSEVEQAQAYGPVEQRQTVLSRLTTFNQLTQVARIVEEDGYLEGETLEYLGYAFIPRVLWPEKPKIAKGSWFALRIGQARLTESGIITNAVNMTIPGELYLNYGWLGVFAGLSLFGWLLAILWDRAAFWRVTSNTLGSAFGYYLLWVGLTMAADLQIVVTLVAMYLLFIGAGWVLSLVSAPLPPGRQPTPSPRRGGQAVART